MQPFTVEWLRAEGFTGFITFSDLNRSEVPKTGGVYVVVRNHESTPVFLGESPAGRFKKKDPSVPVPMLASRWIADCAVIYIGKATNLAARLGQYRDFGAGKPIGHWGGRYIWQLAGADEHVVCWKQSDADPRAEESALLVRFNQVHGRLPFANLRR